MIKHLIRSLVFLSLFSTGVSAYLHPGSGAAPPATCPFGSSFADGCAAADQTATFTDPNALTQFQQSGQISILPTHPQGFNIAGYDYPLGPSAAAAAAYKILGVDPTPTGCSYNPTGNTAGGPLLSCSSSSAAFTIDGYDMTLGGTTCVVISLGGTTTALTTIKNSKFKLLPGCPAVITKLSNAPIQLYNNIYDANWPTVSANIFFFNDTSSGTADTVDIRYNVFLNVGYARIFGGVRGCASRSFRYNYLNTLNAGNLDHAEIDLYGGQGGCAGGPIANVDWEFNFIGLYQTPNQAGDAVFYPSTGALNGISSANTSIIGNTIITNKSTTGATQWGHGIWTGGWANLGNLTVTDNYLDFTGTGICWDNGRVGQGTQNTASASGNTLTLTVGAALGNRVMVGSIITKPTGFTDATITAQTGGTSLGSGTYTFDGPPQTVASSTGWVIAPGYTNPTIARNVSLYDGSTATFPLPAGDSAVCAKSP